MCSQHSQTRFTGVRVRMGGSTGNIRGQGWTGMMRVQGSTCVMGGGVWCPTRVRFDPDRSLLWQLIESLLLKGSTLRGCVNHLTDCVSGDEGRQTVKCQMFFMFTAFINFFCAILSRRNSQVTALIYEGLFCQRRERERERVPLAQHLYIWHMSIQNFKTYI